MNEMDRAANEIHRLGMKSSQQEDTIAELEATIARVEDVYRCAKSMSGGHSLETQKLTKALGSALLKETNDGMD